MRLAIILILLSFPALAGPAKWTKIGCEQLPFAYSGEDYDCYYGKRVPANEHDIFQINRKRDTEFLRITVVDSVVRGYAQPGLTEIMQDFQTVESWAYDNARTMSPLKDMDGGSIAYVLAGDWSCFYHHLMRDRAGGGYRYIQVLVYCEPDNEFLPEQLARRIIQGVEWR